MTKKDCTTTMYKTWNQDCEDRIMSDSDSDYEPSPQPLATGISQPFYFPAAQPSPNYPDQALEQLADPLLHVDEAPAPTETDEGCWGSVENELGLGFAPMLGTNSRTCEDTTFSIQTKGDSSFPALPSGANYRSKTTSPVIHGGFYVSPEMSMESETSAMTLTGPADTLVSQNESTENMTILSPLCTLGRTRSADYASERLSSSVATSSLPLEGFSKLTLKDLQATKSASCDLVSNLQRTLEHGIGTAPNSPLCSESTKLYTKSYQAETNDGISVPTMGEFPTRLEDMSKDSKPSVFSWNENLLKRLSAVHIEDESTQPDPETHHDPIGDQITSEMTFQQNSDGDTMLHVAILQRLQSVVYFILSVVPSHMVLDILNHLNQTPLHLAVLTHQHEIVRQLVSRGARIDTRDSRGNTALHLASRDGCLDCVKALTKPVHHSEIGKCLYRVHFQCVPQDPSLLNYDGQSCVHLAAASKNLELLHYLLSPDTGHSVNIAHGRTGRTILHEAIIQRQLDIVMFLVEFRVKLNLDINVTTYDGVSPLQLARESHQDDVICLLMLIGANEDVG